MADDRLVKAREALHARFRWSKAPDALARRIAAWVDDPADAWIDGTVQVGQVRMGEDRAYAATVVVITGNAITTSAVENVPEVGEPWEVSITTTSRRLRDVRSIVTASDPKLDTNRVDEDDPNSIPLFPPGWAMIAFDDGETLGLPLSSVDEQSRVRLPFDALRRITRATGR